MPNLLYTYIRYICFGLVLWCFVGCCHQDLFNIARNILVLLPSSFFSSRFVSVQVVHPYSSIDTTAAWKKLRFILSVRSDFHMTVWLPSRKLSKLDEPGMQDTAGGAETSS